jgi:hypothetical protein
MLIAQPQTAKQEQEYHALSLGHSQCSNNCSI